MKRIIFIISAFGLLQLVGASSAIGQVSEKDNNAAVSAGNCVIVRIDYCTNWMSTYYGGTKTDEVKLERSKFQAFKDQVNAINNLLVDRLNTLEQEGYRVVSSTSDNLEGSTCGMTFVLYKELGSKKATY